jgi:hypothetical protein
VLTGDNLKKLGPFILGRQRVPAEIVSPTREFPHARISHSSSHSPTSPVLPKVE